MKKIIISVVILFLLFNSTKGDSLIIPAEAIRFRVIANSNTNEDQNIKKIITKQVEADLYNILHNTSDLNVAKNRLENSLSQIDDSVSSILQTHGNPYSYNVHLGKNLFPAKEFKGVIYEEGEYESLVVTLGSGSGENWWCVLFPPLCLLEAEENNISDVEYQFFVKKIIDKIFK